MRFVCAHDKWVNAQLCSLYLLLCIKAGAGLGGCGIYPPMKQRRPFKQKAPHKPSHSKALSGHVLYGFHAVRAAIENPERRIMRLLATQNALASFKVESEVKRPDFEILDAPVFASLMPEGAVHQGIAAVVEPLPALDILDLIESVPEGEPAVFLMLDQVTDPHNVGAIIRSACAFGAKGLVMQDKGAPLLTGVLAKTASGAADVLPVAHTVNLSRAIEMFQENGYFVVGLDERGENIASLPKYERAVLVMGAEGAGLRRLVGEHCDVLASLPTTGKILSLNVSNAAAVALYATIFK